MKWVFLGIALVATLGFSDANSLIPPPPGDECNGPVAGKGLGETLRELVDLLPTENLLEIFLTWVTNDEGVMRAMEYIGSGDFVNIINVMHNKKEFKQVMEFLCAECFFDAYYYLNSLGGIFDFPPMERPYGQRQSRLVFNGLSGFRGMLQELAAALPLDQLREVYERRLATDTFFQDAMNKIGSPEFREVGCAIQATKEYDELIVKLEELGVNTDEILNTLFGFFNWPVHC